MNKIIFSLLILLSYTAGSQVTIDWSKINIGIDSNERVSQFLNSRMSIMEYEPSKVANFHRRNDSFLKVLKPAELVIYNLYYPSQYMQNCNWVPESDSTKRYIYRQIKFAKIADGLTYSDLQQEWIAKNRKLIVAKINLYLVDHKLTEKMILLILQNEFYECIPALLNTYKRQTGKQDYLILSVLFALVDENSFPEKKKSLTFKRLEASKEEGKIMANPFNIIEIKKLAEEYYLFKVSQ